MAIRENFDRDETLLVVTYAINHKLRLLLPSPTHEEFEKIAPIVTVLSPSKSSQEIQTKNLTHYTFGSFLDYKFSEISMMISFKEAPGFENNMEIFNSFIHAISIYRIEEGLTTTSPKEVLKIVITLIDEMPFYNGTDDIIVNILTS
ncbi:hypothetical protein PRIPAC_70468, partial [Pristionchus pacificus]|uniref:Uncharacterized protein n=1 Tax=Pristionchus pacificus TaxID=54126 RepID=A0A2A6BF76_PRIPA